jgi:5'-3' exonuclease
MKYLLIDGNNLAIRAAFANDYMTNERGESSGAHYGFFNSLLNLKSKFPDSQMLVAWDSSSQRRKEETSNALEVGMVSSIYKANRKKGEIPAALQNWFDTGHHLKNALGATGIPQIRVQGFEADDVIATYCELLKAEHEVVVVTSDHDFYQLLDENVCVWDGMKEEYFTKDWFIKENGIEPIRHIDIGALMGDKGDNIFGIPGWGAKTALKEIVEHGSWEGVIQKIEDEYKGNLENYPNLSDEEVFNEYKLAKTEKGTSIYPEIYWGQPYSGLLVGFANKKIKIPKKYLMALMFKERVKLAYSLKSMDTDIEGLPVIEEEEKNKQKLLEYFQYYDIVSLIDRIDVFFNEVEHEYC